MRTSSAHLKVSGINFKVFPSRSFDVLVLGGEEADDEPLHQHTCVQRRVVLLS